MTNSEIRELTLVSVDGRPLPADFRVGDQWVEVIGGTLRGSSTGEACSWTIGDGYGSPPIWDEVAVDDR